MEEEERGRKCGKVSMMSDLKEENTSSFTLSHMIESFYHKNVSYCFLNTAQECDINSWPP